MGTGKTRRLFAVLGALWLATACLGGEARAAVAWPAISLLPRIGGLSQPVQVANAGDGSGRLFVVEQGGRIRVARNGALLGTPFLDIAGRVLAGGERGLLGLAFPPGYAQKGYFYVNYTRQPDGDTVIARFRHIPGADVADPASEEIILVVDQPYANHNGGQLAFGPDGYLYIGMGDGGSSGDPENRAQNPGSLLGKILRIDVESGAAPYGVPLSNPFVANPSYRPEIWALGLRNPWRFGFDRTTGDLYIGDVGQNTYEEIDFQPAASPGGENYGWKIMEGAHCFGTPTCVTAGLTLPVVEYDHSQGCSVTGGTVYRGAAYPQMGGIYFYADYCSGRIWGLARDGGSWGSALLLTVPYNIACFGEDEAGNLYAADHFGGTVYEVVGPDRPPTPPVLVSPADGAGGLPATVTFSWLPSVDPDGDPVAYEFFLDTDPSFAGTVPVPVPLATGREARSRQGPRAGLFLLSSAAVLAGILRPRWRKGLLAALLIPGALLLSGSPGCGGGGGQASPSPPAVPITHDVAGLSPGTTYYWKVRAHGGTAFTDSGTRDFTTAP